jgi:hypothetical protein
MPLSATTAAKGSPALPRPITAIVAHSSDISIILPHL